jgi:lipopolysaccharide export system permease protein
MLRIERYLFRTASSAFLVVLTILTAVIWITQALRQLDLMTDKGQTILVFLTITGLGLPFLCAVIAPVALFNAMLYSLNKLNSDSELIVMSAAGFSPMQLLRPFVALFVLVFLGMSVLYIEVMPRCFDTIQALTGRIHADFIANFARPGVFNELEAGFVFHYRERGEDGSLKGVFIQDRRDPQNVATYIAEKGDIVDHEGQSYLLLLQGSTQRPHGSGDSSLVTFDDYAIDLSQFLHPGDNQVRPREKGTWAMLFDQSQLEPTMVGQVRAELYNRFTSPFYAFAAGLIGFAALGEARTTRQGRGWAIGVAVVLFAVIRLVGLAVNILLRGKPGVPLPVWIPVAAWALPLGSALVGADFIFGGPVSRLSSRLRSKIGAYVVARGSRR